MSVKAKYSYFDPDFLAQWCDKAISAYNSVLKNPFYTPARADLSGWPITENIREDIEARVYVVANLLAKQFSDLGQSFNSEETFDVLYQILEKQGDDWIGASVADGFLAIRRHYSGASVFIEKGTELKSKADLRAQKKKEVLKAAQDFKKRVEHSLDSDQTMVVLRKKLGVEPLNTELKVFVPPPAPPQTNISHSSKFILLTNSISKKKKRTATQIIKKKTGKKRPLKTKVLSPPAAKRKNKINNEPLQPVQVKSVALADSTLIKLNPEKIVKSTEAPNMSTCWREAAKAFVQGRDRDISMGVYTAYNKAHFALNQAAKRAKQTFDLSTDEALNIVQEALQGDEYKDPVLRGFESIRHQFAIKSTGTVIMLDPSDPNARLSLEEHSAKAAQGPLILAAS